MTQNMFFFKFMVYCEGQPCEMSSEIILNLIQIPYPFSSRFIRSAGAWYDFNRLSVEKQKRLKNYLFPSFLRENYKFFSDFTEFNRKNKKQWLMTMYAMWYENTNLLPSLNFVKDYNLKSKPMMNTYIIRIFLISHSYLTQWVISYKI
jgi:hypothetical protein